MDDAPDIHAHLARHLRSLRRGRGLSLDALATRTGVSRSMISLIERGEASPTAVVLNRLAAGLGVSLASLFAEEDTPQASPLVRRAAQRTWRDPDSGYLRRTLSPPGYPSPIELAEVTLPPGARVAYDSGPGAGIGQQVWILEGEVDVATGEDRHRLAAGDCLCMHLDRANVFHNPADRPARYLVALAADPGRARARET
ncbi:helix-turn-helix domain-containing protein [Microvirga thermotolerans]|uniref:Helix-turn-helix domain-containing protein n=1 Tax=Microvirga thermotolerans TaxID=2651334 RepID=A0A5P9K0B1_9HYPH|nr:helix-turn-helix domain-containing protein [Microvirga thermotolerans]QFU16965.1 helix-turn-helix domain-containing protein [Microvirga thermotolerans]